MAIPETFPIKTRCYPCRGTGQIVRQLEVGTESVQCSDCGGNGSVIVYLDVVGLSDAFGTVMRRLKKIMDKLEVNDD